jgi:uncharacterized damage-inducible protein DinB
MTITQLFGNLLEAEAAISRRVLEQVPEGKADWKPHEKSMPMGYLATLVATMPGWIAMMIRQDSLDLRPVGGGGYKPPATHTKALLLAAADESVAQAREALRSTNDTFLETKWQLLVGGHVVDDSPRHMTIASTFTHLGHHRGQLTVYLRLNGAKVPSVYGPSADDRAFG